LKDFERKPVVSGLFYPDKKEELLQTVESLFLDSSFGPGAFPPASKKSGILYGIVSPHAGYVYSGAIAASAFYELSSSNFDTVIIIGPNHYGIGAEVGIMNEGSWTTPFGKIRIDGKMASEISDLCDIVEVDPIAHSRDHCIEVQIPFLQYVRKSATILPIILRDQDKKTSVELGKCIAKIIKNRNVMLVASSDLTHYEPNDRAHAKDTKLISTIQEMNISNFYSVLENFQVTACGYGAIASVMMAAKECGAVNGKLLRYATSGDITGDVRSVVGYSAIAFT
jgi:MEMO1 family protein